MPGDTVSPQRSGNIRLSDMQATISLKVIASSEESKNHWQQKDYKGFNSSTDWDTADFSKVWRRLVHGGSWFDEGSPYCRGCRTGGVMADSSVGGANPALLVHLRSLRVRCL